MERDTIILVALASLSLLASACGDQTAGAAADTPAAAPSAASLAAPSGDSLTITRAGARPVQPGSAERVTGSVRIEPRFAATDSSRAAASSVSFGPGARTAGPEGSPMWMTVGERRFAITLTDNAAARAFAARLPLTLNMDELNGNEKHAELREALPANASRPGTIRNGDLMLYGTNTLVVFYATFNSTYSYTRLGRVDDPAELPQALGRRGVRVVFSKD